MVMTIVTYLHLSRSRIMGAADRTVQDVDGELADNDWKIRHFGKSRLLAYAGHTNYGKEIADGVQRSIRADLPFNGYVSLVEREYKKARERAKEIVLRECGSGKRRSRVRAIFSRPFDPQGFYVELMISGFDGNVGGFRTYHVTGFGDKRVTGDSRFGFIGYESKKSARVLREHLQKYGSEEDVPDDAGAEILLKAVDRSRRVRLGNGRPFGEIQLLIVDSHGHAEEFQPNETTYLLRAVREHKSHPEIADEVYLKRVFKEIVLGKKSSGVVWDTTPKELRDKLGLIAHTDMRI